MISLEKYYAEEKRLRGVLPQRQIALLGKPASFDESRFTHKLEPEIIRGTLEEIDLAGGDPGEGVLPFLRATIRVSPTTTHLVALDVVSVQEENQ